MGSVEKNVDKLEAQLKEWGTKLEEMTAKAADTGVKAKAEAKAQSDKRISDLKAKYQAAEDKLAEFRAAGNGKWDNFKDDIESLWKSLEVTFKNLTH